MDKYTQEVFDWTDAFSDGVEYWDNWLETKGHIWHKHYERRTAGSVEFLYPDLISKVDSQDVKIIDIGCGCLSKLGNVYKDKKINLTSVDVLGEQYSKLLDKYNIVPYSRPEFGLVEFLEILYDKNSYDIVTMTNSLDHSFDPITAIYQLLNLVKINGFVFLEHHENEAEHENYQEFHKWNITVNESGDLIIWSKTESYNINEILGDNAEIETIRRVDIDEGMEEYQNTYIYSTIKKLKDVPFNSRNIQKEILCGFVAKIIDLENKIKKLEINEPEVKVSALQKIFSIKNEGKYKVLRCLGCKIKFKKRTK